MPDRLDCHTKDGFCVKLPVKQQYKGFIKRLNLLVKLNLSVYRLKGPTIACSSPMLPADGIIMAVRPKSSLKSFFADPACPRYPIYRQNINDSKKWYSYRPRNKPQM